MTREELLEGLQSIENEHLEFKKASWDAPQNALETVSAFANAEGGDLVFGVSETDGKFAVTGVANPDNLQNNFHGLLRDLNKVSVDLSATSNILEFPEGAVVCFHIPEADRREKPVFIDKDPRKTFIRKGSGDHQCEPRELARFLREMDQVSYDMEVLEINHKKFYNKNTLRWYREQFKTNQPEATGSLSNEQFLYQQGFLVERGNDLWPTRAAVLVFGSDQYVCQILPRMVVDLQAYYHPKQEDGHLSTTRWSDRVMVEANLIEAWHTILGFFVKHSEIPFALDPYTMQRIDTPPDYKPFREAAMNLLIHQDYGVESRLPTIRLFKDQIDLSNPGSAFVSREKLFTPGNHDVRNQGIVNAFRRIGLSEQAGTGLGIIFSSWRELDYVPPEINNDQVGNNFNMSLRRELLIGEKERQAQESLDIQLSQKEEAVIAFLFRKGEAHLSDIKMLTGDSKSSSLKLMQKLAEQDMVKVTSQQDERIVLTDHLQDVYATVCEEAERAADQTSHIPELSEAQWAIIENAYVPRSLVELMQFAGHSQRFYFKSKHLDPLMAAGIIRMTLPDKPRSPKQQYIMTPIGARLKLSRPEITENV